MTRDHRRPGGEDRADHRPICARSSPAVAARLRRCIACWKQVSAADVSGRHGAAHDVDRRDRHGAAARQGHPGLRHRARAAPRATRINYGAHSDVERLLESSLYVSSSSPGARRWPWRRESDRNRLAKSAIKFANKISEGVGSWRSSAGRRHPRKYRRPTNRPWLPRALPVALDLFGFGSTIGDLIRGKSRKPAAKKRAKKKVAGQGQARSRARRFAPRRKPPREIAPQDMWQIGRRWRGT